MTSEIDRPGCDTHNMVVVHRVFRRELRLLPAEVRAVAPGDQRRADIVGAHAAEILDVLHHHHTGEDDLVWPILRRAGYDVAGRMERQHEQADLLLTDAGPLLTSWKRTADGDSREKLASVLQNLVAVVEEHLDEEESVTLPVVAQTLTAAQWALVGERGMASMRKPRLLVFLGHILEEASPEERAAFMKDVARPARLLFRLFGLHKYRREIAEQRRDLNPASLNAA